MKMILGSIVCVAFAVDFLAVILYLLSCFVADLCLSILEPHQFHGLFFVL